ncbi:hypothetical protein ACFSOZ_12740 [Mesorhizobium newzealandense]|uniref:Uncharacterized protein n=1 Tax=Mesorhizobium newzealandense TaxID=1300302 RepID=A0ABW4U7P0_9HYPH
MTTAHSPFETRSSTARAAAEPSGESTGGQQIDRYNVTSHSPEQQAVPAPVLSSVRMARGHLLNAAFRLDDEGYSCRLLNSLNDGTATLLAEWHGRRRPSIAEELPSYVVAAAIEWRALRDRRRA